MQNKLHDLRLGARLENRVALFPVYRHSVSSLLAFYYEKTFRDLGSSLMLFLR